MESDVDARAADLAPTSSAVSRSAWRRRPPGCAQAGWTSTCVDLTKERLADEAIARRRPRSAFTCRCTRRRGWPAPVIAKVRAAESVGAALRLRPVCAAQRGVAAIARRRRRARRRVRRGADGDRARSLESPAPIDGPASRRDAEPATDPASARCLAFISRARSPGLAAARTLRDAADARRHARASSGPPRPAAAAGICAGIVRSCRSTTGSSASCSRTSCWRTSTRRSPPAPQHITFGDPDFFNGPTHAMRIVDALHAAHPSVTYDVTIKIEHLLQHRELLPRLRDTGCLFVTSAVESVDDRVLGAAGQGPHARAISSRRSRSAARAG